MAYVETGLGLALVALGVLVALLGHKRLPVHEGRVMRAVSPSGWGSKVRARLLSIVIGVLLIGFGLSLIFEQ